MEIRAEVRAPPAGDPDAPVPKNPFPVRGRGGEGLGTVAGAGPPVPLPVNDPAVGPDLDLDLLGILRVTAGKQRLAATGADTSLRRQFPGFLVGRQAGIIAAFGPGILRLLATIPPGWRGAVLRVIQMIGAIVQRPGFGTSSEEIGLELPLFAFEVFDFLLRGRDAEQGIAMATLPVSDLLAELEVLAL